MQSGEPRRRQRGVPSGETLKITEISIFFENFSNGVWEAAGPPKCPQELPKEPKRGPEGSLSGLLWCHFWQQNWYIGTLLEHCYLQHFQHKMKVWGDSDALWEAIWNSIFRAVTTLGVSSALLCPAGSSWGWKMVTTGSQRGLRRASKITQNRFKITLGPHWWTKACRGVPPRCLRDTQSAYLCIFMHVFIRIGAYSCIFMHVYGCIHACSCIFMHISCMFHAYVCISMHIVHIYVYLWFRGNTYTLNIKLCNIGLNSNWS